MTTIAGVDGCLFGWLCVTQDTSHKTTIEASLFENFEKLMAPKPDVVMVDIPIGLPDGLEKEYRLCDKKMRDFIKPRSSSVFTAPIRPMLRALTLKDGTFKERYEKACQIGKETNGKMLSRQSFSILRKIKEVDDFLARNEEFKIRIWEIHPEVCFCAWNNKKAMVYGKKSKEGKNEREKFVIEKYGEAYANAQSQLGTKRGKYGDDDLLDAFAALWTAERFTNNEADLIPEDPEFDSCGLRMQIVV